MSSIKDKLTQSVRQARSAQPAQPAKAARPAPARKSAAKVAEPATKAVSAAEPSAQQGPQADGPRLMDEPASSASALFPQRVWPD
ncbi:MAG: hypothetical protein ACUVSD_09375 [Thiobacillaceae bacterium]